MFTPFEIPNGLLQTALEMLAASTKRKLNNEGRRMLPAVKDAIANDLRQIDNMILNMRGSNFDDISIITPKNHKVNPKN